MRLTTLFKRAITLFVLVPQLALGSAVVFSGSDVKTLKQNIDLNGQTKILSGTVDPTSSATSAPIGSLYLNKSSGKYFRKLDAGSSTNWVELGDRQPSENILSNNGFEVDLGDWTATSITATRTTTSGQYARGIAGVSLDGTGAGGTFTTGSYQLADKREYLAGANMVAQCRFKYASTIGTNILEVRSAGVTIASMTISADTAGFRNNKLNFVGPTGGNSVSIRVLTVAADEPVLYMDDCYVGKADNLGEVAQTKLALMASPSSSCDAQTTSSPFVFPTTAACTGITINANQIGTWATTDFDGPAVQCTSCPAGYYTAKFHARYLSNSNASIETRAKMYIDNAAAGPETYANVASSNYTMPSEIAGFYHATTAKTNLNFEIKLGTGGGPTGTATVGYGAGGPVWEIWYTPLNSDSVTTPDLKNTWGAVEMVSTSGASSTSSTYATASVAGFATKAKYGKCLDPGTANDFACKVETLPAGAYEVEVVSFSNAFSSTTAGDDTICKFAIYDGTTRKEVGLAEAFNGSSGTLQEIDTISNYSAVFNYAAQQSNITFSAQLKRHAGTGSCSIASVGNAFLIIKPLSENVPQPVFIGSVTSNSVGAERIERAYLNCDAAPVINSQSGTWVTGITHPATGQCAVTWASTTFASAPTCSATPIVNTNGTQIGFSAIPSTTGTTVLIRNGSGTAEDNDFQLICMGPK